MNFKSKFLLEEHLSFGNILLENTCKNLTESQIKIIKGIYHEFLPLIEASLTTDQINQLFQNVEQQATASGSNRTLLGKAKDVTSQVNDVINKVGKWLQDTTPVKFADQKFADLKMKVAAKFPELDQQLTSFGTWMKENPGKSAAVIGVLTALASLAGGPIGGAIAGQVLRGAAELIKGEKLSTAVGKGIKTAALGYLSGKAFQLLGNWVGSFREQSIPFGTDDAGLERVSWGATRTISSPGMEWTRTTRGFEALVRPEEAEVIRNAMAGIKSGQPGAFDSLLTVAREVNSKDYMKTLDGMVQGAWQAAKDNDSILQFINTAKQGLQAAAQGAVAASTGSASAAQSPVQPTVEQIQQVFQQINDHYLDEGILDAIKGAAGKAVDWAKTKGTNLTTKVTADKLQQAWKAAGSPTDSEEVKKILQSAGVDTGIIDQSYTKIGISTATPDATEPDNAAQPTVDVGTINKSISKLPRTDLEKLQQIVNDALLTRSK